VEALEHARHELRLEGLESSPFAEVLLRRYAEGELTAGEVRQHLLNHYK
jgi:hypothetical protein